MICSRRGPSISTEGGREREKEERRSEGEVEGRKKKEEVEEGW